MKPSLLAPDTPKKLKAKLSWSGLHGSASALVIARAVQSENRLITVVTPDSQTATQLEYDLRFFLGESEQHAILNFPDWETLPYDLFSPHQDITSERLHVLSRLPHIKSGVLILSIHTLFNRLAPKTFLQGQSLHYNVGDAVNITHMSQLLEQSSYRRTEQVFEHGEFAVRGSIVDLFPMGSELPYRIELFDDEIDTIRTFNIETQRTVEKIQAINLLPAKEFPMTESAISLFRSQWRDHFTSNPAKCPMYNEVTDGITSPGIEYYLPLFFENTANILDYLPEDSLLIRYYDVQTPANHFENEIKQRYEQLAHDIRRPILNPDVAFFVEHEVFHYMNQFSQIMLQDDVSEKKQDVFLTHPLPNIEINHKLKKPLTQLQAFLTHHQQRILFCAETKGRKESILTFLKDIGAYPREIKSWQAFVDSDEAMAICVHPLNQGFIADQENITIISESQLFGSRVLQRRRRKKIKQDSQDAIANLAELRIDDPVVHIDHGVGRYRGLEVLTLNNQAQEFLCLEYAGKSKLYVPISALHLISRYSGAELERAPLHTLGNDKWGKAKRKAQQKIYDVAAELLEVQARRNAQQGYAFQCDEDYEVFANGFAFEETPDQETSIEAVLNDMQSIKPMDRLVCGDVGFGKTEVAMRAAFVAVNNQKQVAILAPTTLLVEQHGQTFADRFADWPVNIAVISRFKTAKEQKIIISKLLEGKIDIVIGTHKLLSKDVQFKDLGLIIIDEEHRFGVRQKEQLNRKRANTDILTLTATPIPRTLNMAFSGIRDLSIIATPPAKRLAVKTFIYKRNDQLIQEAIQREILRGGQVYFLHNNVDTIKRVAEDLQKLIPDAHIAIGHGQMRERELEQVMTDFYHRRFNVLVCTTIIETGIDIPSSNTILIDRADKFGLAQLHQLRGRVGRSHHQAYAYLLTPDEAAITPDAKKRLEAISCYEDLGIGFTLATHDLEIRGAGELLGDEQSGHIQEIGFTLYMELLDRAVKALKRGEKMDLEAPINVGCEIEIKVPSIIPEDYLADVHMRLIFYKRIAGCGDLDSLKELQVEMIDRYGLLPTSLKNLFSMTELKLQADQLGIQKIESTRQSARISFGPQPKIDPTKLIQLVQTQPKRYQFEGASQIKLLFEQALEFDQVFESLHESIKALAQ